MKYTLLILQIAICSALFSQPPDYRTYYGCKMSPVDTLRALNIFINIIYDQGDPEVYDPCYDVSTPYWMPGPTNTINTNPPTFLIDFMDTAYNPNNIHGTFTKRYAEASFNRLIVLGDFMSVNIAQSYITPNDSNDDFSYKELANATISLINDSGGLQAIYGHNDIKDYDTTVISSATNYKFLPKPVIGNEKIDLYQFFMRNCTEKHGSFDNGGQAHVTLTEKLLINGIEYDYDGATIQGAVKTRDLSDPKYQPAEIHELAHILLGNTNCAHMGGGGPLDCGDLTTLEANSGGWSLIGSQPSSLISCNGYERWRLGWYRPIDDTCGLEIAASCINSDIEKSDSSNTFILRDFITSGDVVRIKLPYIDSGALDQFIWLENHQIHNNNKEDYPAYWTRDCKDDGVPGIYAYYQVGKNLREDTISRDNIYPLLTDHLVPICADGKWDITVSGNMQNNCVNYDNQNIQDYYQENPFCGYHDLENHYFNSISGNTINADDHKTEILIKLENGDTLRKLANMGDNNDAFTGRTYISMSTNPAPVNVITYHHTRSSSTGTITKSDRIDNRKIHLSGLRIDISDQEDSTYKVDVSWDEYNIYDDVRWTGDIVLHEEVNLLSNKTITIDQNYTPNKHIRDTITGLFAGPTYFTCLDNSLFKMQSNSDVILEKPVKVIT